MIDNSQQEKVFCGECKNTSMRLIAVIHHKPCAYVGPIYDFSTHGDNVTCPKCLRLFCRSNDTECGILGVVFFCDECGKEELH